uniref:Uncharacterized protein n=1 Tax=Parastrongyloides trichosuri TaxID=131310 RepID=A0A0N4Z4V2_PARTI
MKLNVIIFLFIFVQISTVKGSLVNLYMSGFLDTKKVAAPSYDGKREIYNSKSRNCFFSPVHCVLLNKNPESVMMFRHLPTVNDKKYFDYYRLKNLLNIHNV